MKCGECGAWCGQLDSHMSSCHSGYMSTLLLQTIRFVTLPAALSLCCKPQGLFRYRYRYFYSSVGTLLAGLRIRSRIRICKDTKINLQIRIRIRNKFIKRTKISYGSLKQLHTVKRGKIGHLITFRSKLKIVESIFCEFFPQKSLYELWAL